MCLGATVCLSAYSWRLLFAFQSLPLHTFLTVKGRAISLKHILIALAQKSLLNCQVLRSFPSPIFQQDKQGFLFWLFSTSLLIHASSQREWRQVVFPRASSPAKSWSLTSSLSAVHAVRSGPLCTWSQRPKYICSYLSILTVTIVTNSILVTIMSSTFISLNHWDEIVIPAVPTFPTPTTTTSHGNPQPPRRHTPPSLPPLPSSCIPMSAYNMQIQQMVTW